VEWEKAARGADGRFFPWGNHFDWSFTSGGESKGGTRQPDKIGEFEKDESPYGVRDLGGSMREWCGDWEDEKKGYARVRGGSWGYTVITFFRSATRNWDERADVSAIFGIRVARAPGLR
jgi:serine/threonine-protein kinase